MAERRILIVDDEADVRFPLGRFLRGKGFVVIEAEGLAAARETLRRQMVDAAVVDFSLADGDGLEVLAALKAQDASLPVVLLTGHGTIDLAVKAIKEGAEQFFTKPVELPALLVVIERALENRRMRQVSLAGKSAQVRQAVDPFFGESGVIRKLAAEAARVAASKVPVLIQGETGSGKGVLARWLHEASARADESFVDLNCAGLSRELLETELFGHEKGAFTGAVTAKQGLLEVAHRGTLFLDEIGDVDLQVQAKLLKVVEDMRFRRLGDVRDRQVDVRLVAATHRDLALLVREQKFREDLYYRISALPVVVPPLRERGKDVVLLARQLVERISAEMGRPGVRLSPEAEDALAASAWPGNVRQLRNVLERAVLLSDRSVLEPSDFGPSSGPSVASADVGINPRMSLADAERRHIEAVLSDVRGAVPEAARVLGISRSALYERIKKYGLAPRPSSGG
ncbi:MAG TPA: sigma-54 dependent transcriptional regulator [Vicinamibacteria bacterium]|nr:sigma-54 dependent transcriptional regulator [Vicinamibacteria bacterium]